jgi:predicted transcriptional regulator
MLVKEVMTPKPEIISVNASLREAAKKMKALDVGFLPVEEQDHSITGIVTDRDIALRGVAEKKDPSKTRVKDIMSHNVVTCPENADIQDAVQAMEKNKVRRLIITDSSGKPAGIISIGDIATHAEKISGEIFRSLSEHSHPTH